MLLPGPRTAGLKRYLDDAQDQGHTLVSSRLLATEVRRVVAREGGDWNAATEALAAVDLVALEREDLELAATLPGARLYTLDAIHLATALRIGAHAVVGYDQGMMAAARGCGLRTASP